MTATVLLLSLAASAVPTDEAYVKELDAWRTRREESLLQPGGWLSVAGLSWLKPGENTVGSSEGSDVRFPAAAPARIGKFVLEGGKVVFHAEPGVSSTMGGSTVQTVELKPDSAEGQVVLGDLTFMAIHRIDRTGIRLWDLNAETRRNFKGLEWYPIDPAYRVTAKFVPFEEPKMVPILNVIGDTRVAPFPGYVVFTLEGKENRLEAEDTGDGLFFNFKDKTSSDTTYGAGRYLSAEYAKDGIVILDFNKAVSPPCAYTDFATCPLPPKENTLKIAVPAGEKSLPH